MDALLLVLALALNAVDAVNTCRGLRAGAVEQNPLMGQSCARVVAVKSAAFAVIPLWPRGPVRRVYVGSLAVAGGVGFALSVKY